MDSQQRFRDSLDAFDTSRQRIERLNTAIGRRKPDGFETFAGVVLLGDVIVKMLIAIREGDNWLNGH